MAGQERYPKGVGSLYCRPDLRNQPRVSRTSNRYCECGYKIRGRYHDEGSHHKSKIVKEIP